MSEVARVPDGQSAAGSGLLRSGEPAVTERFDEIPVEERTLAAIVRNALRRVDDQDRVFLNFRGETSLTYRQLRADIAAWERTLDDLSVDKGGRVAVMLPNCVEYVSLLLALGNTGRVSVPVNVTLKGWSLEYTLADSEAELLVISSDFVEHLDSSWDLPSLKQLITVGSTAAGTPAGPWQSRTLEEVWAGSTTRAEGQSSPLEATLSETPVLPDDVAAIMYTSGTTGPPKGAVVTHEYYAFYSWGFAYPLGFRSDDVLFTLNPLFHVYAQFAFLLPALRCGASLVLYDRFSASDFWNWVADSRATVVGATGTIGNVLMKRDDSEFRSDHCVRLLDMAPAVDDIREFERRFKVPLVYQQYGMTEGLYVLPSHDRDPRPGCCGQEMPYHDLRIVDTDDREVPVGTVGEIVVRPKVPNIMFREYLRKPSATVESTRNLWFHTGDLGKLDHEGNLWFEGRLKDIIRRRGENISAFLIERELLTHDDVMEVAAFGIPADVGDEEVKVCVVPTDPANAPTAKELHAFCADRLPRHMVPRFIEFKQELPKNASLRILKYVLAAEGRTPETWDLLSGPSA
jgi:crotonobetaine/carnitine-CoA ligase